MRRLFLTLLALCAPACAYAQGSFTSVTGIVQDPLANIYQNGTFSINFFDPGTSGKQPLLPGNQPFQTQFSGSLDSFGLFNVSLADNGVIASASGATGTSWQFFMCANPGILRLTTSNAIPCFSYSTPIICASNTPTTCSASTINITAQLKAVAAYLPIVNGTAAAKPILPYNPIQYVSQNGSDTNDGLSWGTSKATVYGALLALPGGGAGFAGSGTVYVGPNSSANPTAGAGIWIMSSLDPNYASPPAGWLKCNQPCATTVVGVGSSSSGYTWKPILVPMTAGSTADRNHPSVWLSGLNHSFDIFNISFSGSQRPIVVGECSNHDRSGTCLSFGGLLDSIDVNVTVVNASSGPGIDLAATTFQEIRNGSCTGSTGAVVTYTADNAACILQVGGSLRVTNEELFHGGIKVLGLGPNPGQFGTYAYNVDEYGDNTNTQPPAVWFTNYTQLADSVLQNITQQYGSAAVGAIRVEAPTVLQFGPTVIGGAGVVVVGPATILSSLPYYYVQSANKAVTNRQVGFINGYMFGETNVARRIGSLLPTRFTNRANSSPASWTSTGSNVITLAQTDPFGGTNAAKFHTTSGPGGQTISLGATSAYTPAINDWIVGGAWIKGALSGIGSIAVNSPGVTFTTQSSWGGVDIGDGNEWIWQYFAYKVAANAGATTLQLQHSYLSTGDVTLYGPVLYVLPAASVSDDEALWFANSANSIDTTCAVGNICTVSGHPLQVPGLTAGNCVQASTGGVLTTTSASCGIGGGSLLSSVNTTPVTVNANVTTTQTLQAAQSPISAGTMNTLGKTIRITSAGVFNPVNNTETTTFAFTPGGGGNAVFYPYVATTNGSNIAWSITANCTTTTTGVAGVLTCIANLSIGNVVSGAGAPTFNSGLTASGGTFSGVDLTGTLTPAFFVSFNSASASNTAAGNYLMVEQLN